MNARHKLGMISKVILAVVLLLCFLPVRQAQANHPADVNISVFYRALAPYGNWVNHRSYGRVWFPRNVPRNWRPYTDGYWAYTVEYGWLWVSDWEWGWAPFHYGRWAWDDWYGWIWVPGRIWAPAWVFWRYGGGYAAWAPMPPNYIWRPGAGFGGHYFDYDRYIGWDSWVTVHQRDFPHRHIRNKILAPQQNFRILRETKHIDNVRIVNNNIINQGVPVREIEKVTGAPLRPIRPVILTGSNSFEKQHSRGDQGEEPVIFRPKDVATTPEAIQDEEQRARYIADKIDKEPAPNLLPKPEAKHHTLEQREPGRLSGKPMPIENQELPNSISTLPEEDRSQSQSYPRLTIPGSQLDGEVNHLKQSMGQQQFDSGRRVEQDIKQQMKPDRQPNVDIEQQAGEKVRAGDELRLLDKQQQAVQEKQMQEQAEQEKQMQEQARQQEELARQQQEQIRQQEAERRQQMEMQQQAEQEKQMQEQARQQEELARQQQEQIRQQETDRRQQMEMQQQAEQEKQMQEQARQQEELARQQQEQIRQQETDRRQQMEMQQQAEQEKQMQEQARQQEELARQQQEQIRQQETDRRQQLEMQQQAEQEKQMQEQARQQEELARQQQEQIRQQETDRRQQMEMQQQAEQKKQMQEQARQQEELARQQQEQIRQQETDRRQQMEMQQQAEQEKQMQEQARQQEEVARQQQETDRRQQMEMQQQAEQEKQMQEQAQQQEEVARQQQEAERRQQMEMQQKRTEVQQQPEQSGRGRGSRDFNRGERFR